jgi:biotin synthase
MVTLSQLREWYALPLTTLIFRAQAAHHRFHDPAGVQLCTLQSIKTGRCPENCAYCPQSAHHETGLADVPLMDADDIIAKAQQARAGGASRFCMGAAWREVRDGPQFDSVLRAVAGVSEQGLEVCCTLGMLTQNQAERLKDAGCRVYNHNLDTSREYYPQIITTRCYDDRLQTLENVRAAGLEVCCGGILGLGESVDDRLKMLAELAALDPPPESVPINALVPVAGTPLAERPPVDAFEFVRIIAVARLALPKAIVRLSAGRTEMSAETQALCFLAGANSIFLGEKLLTTPNPAAEEDFQLLQRLGLHALDPEATRQLQATAGEPATSR